MHRFVALLALAFGLLALQPGTALADPADIEATSRGVVRVVIIGSDGDAIFPVGHGTGFSVGGERFVTNAHVIAEAIDDERLSIGIVPAEGGEAVYARIVNVSVRNDLALLATTEPLGLPPLTIAGNPMQDGQVTAIGYPMNVDRAQGLSFSDMFRAQPPVTATGFLSGRRPSRDFDTLLHTASIAAGNSGGPLVDPCGRVIGVNSFGTESAGSDAEFFFAVSTRELLPFLRANGVTPRINSSTCRSMADLDAEERARAEQQREEAERLAEEEAVAAEARTDELRRTIGYEVLDERSNGLALSFLLLLIATAAGGTAAFAHHARDFRLRAIAGGVALVALTGASIAWFTRPAFAEIDERVEQELRDGMEGGAETGPIAVASSSGEYTCVLEVERSRFVGDPEEDITIGWNDEGCVNGRTQYGIDAGNWTRVFVPGSEAAVSVNSFDPEGGTFIMERYLLGRDAMTQARAARGQYQAPSCGSDEAAAREFGSKQDAISAALPEQPNERLVYRCARDGENR